MTRDGPCGPVNAAAKHVDFLRLFVDDALSVGELDQCRYMKSQQDTNYAALTGK